MMNTLNLKSMKPNFLKAHVYFFYVIMMISKKNFVNAKNINQISLKYLKQCLVEQLKINRWLYS